MGCDRDVNCFPLAHQPAAGRGDRKKEEKKVGKGIYNFGIFSKVSISCFLLPLFCVKDFFSKWISTNLISSTFKKKRLCLALSKVLTFL